MTLAVIVPVMRRPQNAVPFMQSIGNAPVAVYAVADADDIDTVKAWWETGAQVLISKRGRTFPNKVQHAYLHTTQDWLLLVGDDVRFHQGWFDAAEAAMGSSVGLIATNDLGNPYVMAGTHATHPIIARCYVDSLGSSWDGPGHIVCESYVHSWCDEEWSTVAKHDGVFVYAPDCKIEHLHPTWGKGRDDEVYWVARDSLQADGELYARRLAQAKRDGKA